MGGSGTDVGSFRVCVGLNRGLRAAWLSTGCKIGELQSKCHGIEIP